MRAVTIIKLRQAIAVFLVVPGCIAATVGVGIIWLDRAVLGTEKYVEIVAPLGEDPAIKDALAATVADELFKTINAGRLAEEVLPDQVDFLADPIAGATQGFFQEQVREELDSSWFPPLWTQLNRKAHQSVRSLLLGEGGIVKAQEGRVTIDLQSLFGDIKEKLAAKGINVFESISLPEQGAQFTIFKSPGLDRAQGAIKLLDRLAFWLPAISLILWSAAIGISYWRLATIMRIGLGFAAGMAVLLVALTFVQGEYMDALNTDQSINAAAAASFFNAFADSLKTTIHWMFAAGLITAVAGFAFSHYLPAVRARAWLSDLYGIAMAKGEEIDLGPLGAWVAAQKTLLRVAGIILALVVLIAGEPSLLSALLIGALLGLYIGILEYISRRAA